MSCMDVVRQKHPTGCGIASVAMLAGTDYDTVRETAAGMGISADDRRLYSETDYVRRLLDAYGLHASPGERPFTGWHDLSDRALLAVYESNAEGRPQWHWVVFERENGNPVVLDPATDAPSNRRTDFDELMPSWSIAVQ